MQEIGDLLLPSQVLKLVYWLSVVIRRGNGEVTIKIIKGKPRFIVGTISELMPDN